MKTRTHKLPTLRTFALVPALALAAACSDCTEEPGLDAGPDGPADIDAAAKELCVAITIGNNNVFYAALHGLTRCSVTDAWPEVAPELLQAYGDTCVAGNEFYDMFIVAFEGDRVNIDVDRSFACIDKGRGARANVSPFAYNNGENTLLDLFDDADCSDAATPLLSSGDTCVQSWDCPDELPCQADPPDSATLRCLAPASDGGQCGGTRLCGADLSCIDEVCAGPIAQGADCVTGNEGGARSCAAGSYCDAAASGVCQLQKPANAVCANTAECEDPLSCDRTTLICTAAPPAIADDAACDPDTDGCAVSCSVCRAESLDGPTLCLDRAPAGDYCEDTNHCRTGFECDLAASKCVVEVEEVLPQLGQECGVNGAPFGCEEGSCVLSVCTAGVETDPCEPDFPACLDGLVCEPDVVDETRGTCVAEPALGDDCIGGQCAFGAYCNDSGQCAAVGETGDACAEGFQCDSGTCLATTNTCAATGPSCYASRGIFIQMLTLAFLLPLFVRIRRRRRR